MHRTAAATAPRLAALLSAPFAWSAMAHYSAAVLEVGREGGSPAHYSGRKIFPRKLIPGGLFFHSCSSCLKEIENTITVAEMTGTRKRKRK